MNRTLSGIAAGRLSVSPRNSRAAYENSYFVTLNSGNPVQLRGPLGLAIEVGHAIRVLPTGDQNGLFTVDTVAYWYHFLAAESREVISFHWNRLAVPPERPYPHIHVGSVVTAASPVLQDRFNKLHIPSGPLSLATVITFAIEELGTDVLPGRSRTDVLRELHHLDDLLRGWDP